MVPVTRKRLVTALIAAVSIVLGVFAGSYVRHHFADQGEAVVAFQTPRLVGVNATVRLTNAPTSSASDYFGAGNPYVLVTYSGAGGLQSILTHAEIQMESNVGADACKTPYTFDSFTLIAPTSASNETMNVTYASDSYSPTMSAAPGGDHCAARISLEATWTVTVCAEGDGRLDAPTTTGHTTVVDTWDWCFKQGIHTRAPLPLGTLNLDALG